MMTEKDIQVISFVVAELLLELNYKKAAAIRGNKNARKLESHGYIEAEGQIKKGVITIRLSVKDFDDGSLAVDQLMAGISARNWPG